MLATTWSCGVRRGHFRATRIWFGPGAASPCRAMPGTGRSAPGLLAERQRRRAHCAARWPGSQHSARTALRAARCQAARPDRQRASIQRSVQRRWPPVQHRSGSLPGRAAREHRPRRTAHQFHLPAPNGSRPSRLPARARSRDPRSLVRCPRHAASTRTVRPVMHGGRQQIEALVLQQPSEAEQSWRSAMRKRRRRHGTEHEWRMPQNKQPVSIDQALLAKPRGDVFTERDHRIGLSRQPALQHHQQWHHVAGMGIGIVHHHDGRHADEPQRRQQQQVQRSRHRANRHIELECGEPPGKPRHCQRHLRKTPRPDVRLR